MDARLFLAPEVRDALALGRPVVALETSVVVQGLPRPANLEAARRCAAAVRESGAVPAFLAVLGGRICVGAGEGELARLSDPAARARKVGIRDLAAVVASGRDGATTVSAGCAIAARAGIRVFVTGGIGGVHRRAHSSEPLDVSADLAELARCPVCVVSAGPKAVLDVPSTAETLEALGVPVVGWRTSELPAFFAGSSGIPLEHRVEDAAQAAELLRIQWEVLERSEGVLLCVAPPDALPSAEVERAISGALAEAAGRSVGGKGLTPFLLESVARATEGRSQRANLALLEANARVAGAVAAALSAPR